MINISMNRKKIHWKKLKSTVLYKHPRIELIEDEVVLPSGDIISYLKFGQGGKGVTIICIKNNKVLLQKEYSYPVDDVLFQFPGGKVEKNETIIQAARRELLEESGRKAGKITKLGWYFVNNRRTNAKMYVVLARFMAITKEAEGDLEEDIKSQWVTKEKLNAMIQNGKIVNYSALAAWALFEHKSDLLAKSL